jgi:hypothetical protein
MTVHLSTHAVPLVAGAVIPAGRAVANAAAVPATPSAASSFARASGDGASTLAERRSSFSKSVSQAPVR